MDISVDASVDGSVSLTADRKTVNASTRGEIDRSGNKLVRSQTRPWTLWIKAFTDARVAVRSIVS